MERGAQLSGHSQIDSLFSDRRDIFRIAVCYLVLCIVNRNYIKRFYCLKKVLIFFFFIVESMMIFALEANM